MQIHNFLGDFVACMRRWETLPPVDAFLREYYAQVEPWISPMLDDFGYEPGGRDFFSSLADLEWAGYRAQVLTLDPAREETRVRAQLEGVEKLLGQKLQGEAILFSAFTLMDGYARFDRGTHRVFLAADESHAQGPYLDVLYAHELTHVVRESQASVWQGFGLDPKMSHHDFTEHQPVIEHLFSEGFSCAVSERLVPGGPSGGYAYQTAESLAAVLKHADYLNDTIHRELDRGVDGDFGRLYGAGGRGPARSPYAHYVWAWQWVKQLIAERGGGDPRALAGICSKDFLDHARAFRLGAGI